MAKVKCQLVNIYAPSSEQRMLMRRLQEMSIIDIVTAAGDEATGTPAQGYVKEDVEALVSSIERNLDRAENAIKILDVYSPAKKGLLASFKGLPEIDKQDFYLDEKRRNFIGEIAGEIINCEHFIDQDKAEIMRLRTGVEQMAPWADFDLPLTYSGTSSTYAAVGTVAGLYNAGEIENKLADDFPDLTAYVEIVRQDGNGTAIVLMCPKSQKALADEALRTLSFARPTQLTSKLPKVKIQTRLDRIVEAEKRIEENTSKIKSFGDMRRELEKFADHCRARVEHYKTLGDIEHTDHTILIKGYVASPDITYLKKKLEKDFTVVIEVFEPDPDLAPVKLKNNWFFKPAETITSMYSLPSDKDIDPTPLTGFFYYILFGMMLSDAGYGLLLTLGSLLAILLFKPAQKMKNNLKMFLYCGISTMVWGGLFGSFFGNSFEVFFHKPLPHVLDPMNGDAVKLLILSVIIGFVQIIAGLIAKMITEFHNHNPLGALFDAGLWITLLCGIACMAASLVGISILMTVGMYISIASAIGLVLTQGRGKKGIVMKFVGGLASLYDITGYVSDLLSFSRLMALGLTTAAMASVFNLLGEMMLPMGVIGIIAMALIFILGHLLTFALNALGTYVHTLRLQYVELFSKFYEGGGREFKAFSYKNKYVGIKPDKEEK